MFLEKLTVPQLVKKFPAFFLETEGSLPHSQDPANRPYSEPDQFSPCHLPNHFLNIHFNTIFLSTPRSSKWPFSFRFPPQNPVRTSRLSHTCHMSCPSHSSWFDHLASNTDHKALRFAFFPISSSPCPSASHSLKPSAFILPSLWHTKFHFFFLYGSTTPV